MPTEQMNAKQTNELENIDKFSASSRFVILTYSSCPYCFVLRKI